MTAFQLDKHTDRSRLCFLMLSIILAYAYFANDRSSIYFIFALTVMAFSDLEKAEHKLLKLAAYATYTIYFAWILYIVVRWFSEFL